MLKKTSFSVLSLLLALLVTAGFAPRAEAASAARVDIVGMSVSELQAAVDEGALTYELITQLYLERIEAYGEQYECIISLNENALEEARARDEEFEAAGRSRLSELFGMPVIVKDNIDVEGLATTAGSEALLDSLPYENAAVVEALLEQGAIIIAKANMDEFALNASSSESDFGTVKNAYSLERSSYGSSGGSAVSVAASLAPLALGTDTNSSIRIPASANGVVGLRPSYGLLDTAGVLHYDYARDVVGPMALSVYDCALLLSGMSGGDYLSSLASASLEGLTVGVCVELCYELEMYEDVAARFEEALSLFEAAGAEVVEVEGMASSYFRSYQKQMQSGWTMRGCFEEYIQGTASAIKSFAELAALDPGSGIAGYADSELNYLTDSRLTSIFASRESYRQQFEAIMDEYGIDVLIYPSMRNTVMTPQTQEVLSNNSSIIAPFTGMPALSLPMGFDSNGLPVGLEFLARFGDEETLLAAAYAYELERGDLKLTELAPALYDAEEEARLYELELEEQALGEAQRLAEEAWDRARESFLSFAIIAASVCGLAVVIALLASSRRKRKNKRKKARAAASHKLAEPRESPNNREKANKG
ncbi:MAG: amidase [Oscillospiraceae bacterium]|nr:amidase [Oscillospiraceae bacterium]